MKSSVYSEKSYSFFTRMLLICTVLLACFSISACIVIGHLSRQYEESQFLNTYELALINLSESFFGRFEDFGFFAGKLLAEGHCSPELSKLLEAPSYDDVPASLRSSSINLLADICQDDQYLKGFLIYSPEMQQLYYYTESQSYLFHTSSLPQMQEPVPFAGSKISPDSINKMIEACTDGTEPQKQYFGIAATIYRYPSAPLGYVIPLYSLSEYDNILSGFDLSENSMFYVKNNSGQIFYNSNPAMDTDSGQYYSNEIHNNRYGFTAAYRVPKSFLPQSSITSLIFVFAVLVTLFSFGLYYLTYYLSNRNINWILGGMKHFNAKNLKYRIKKPKSRNEFTQIIEGFNAMCDELQRNVERTYVYELQQKKSELYALQTSINPHFLYNTLEMIRIQILNANLTTASQMILLLSNLYRSQTNTAMFVTLEDEVELCENLMILYQYRFQNFDYDFYLDDEIQHFALPKHTLQPLIENYFVHGIAADRQDNMFTLSIRPYYKANKQYIHLILCNNGNPITPQRLDFIEKRLKAGVYTNNETAGFAITNVVNRLQLVFSNDCEMKVSSGSNSMCFQIELTFPAMTLSNIRDSFT